jgi:hypothetical protein
MLAEDVLVVEQDYSAVDADRKSIARNVHQTMYLSPRWIRIDEFEAPNDQPSESIMVDLDKRILVTLTPTTDRSSYYKVVESFSDRRARILQRVEKLKADLNSQPADTRPDFLRKHQSALDGELEFKLQKGSAQDAKQIANTQSIPLTIQTGSSEATPPLKLYPHPEIRLPYESAEVLFLLHIVGGKMERFLREHKAEFQFLPLEMDLDLASGGRLTLIVKDVKRVARETLRPDLNDYSQFPDKPVKALIKDNSTPD